MLGWADDAPASSPSSPASYRYVTDVLFDHEMHMRELAKRKMAPLHAAQQDIGEIAVIEDDGTLLMDAVDNQFDLDGSSVELSPRGPAAYDVACTPFAFDSTLGTPVELGDDTCTYVPFTGGFTFTFYGTTYTGVYICSNGCLTFEEEEDVYFERSVAEFLYEEPRVGVFYNDIDPTRKGAVTYRQEADAFTVTWDDVSEYTAGADLNSNTFQIRLDSSGTIVFSYNGMDATDSIVGLTPGGETPFSTLDYDADCPVSPDGPALLERFETANPSGPRVDIVLLGRRFYETHNDTFDYLVLFTDFDVVLGDAFAYAVTVKNEVLGLGDILPGNEGDDLFDNTATFGSAGRLKSFLNMGEIRRYDDDPHENVLRSFSSLDLIAHEAAHLWLAHALFMDGEEPSTELLGRQMAHWSFYMDTDASVMEGNDWQDNGDGTFTTIATTERYSALDLYLMGFLAPDDVAPFFIIRNPDPDLGADRSPGINITVNGEKKWVTIDDIIAAIGPRDPSWRASQKRFRQAFVLLVENGQSPKPGSIDRLDMLRTSWEQFFHQLTLENGRIDTSLTLVPPVVEGTPSGSRSRWYTLAMVTLVLGVAALAGRRITS